MTTTARADLRDILRWTSERFGEEQARIYADTLAKAIGELATGPDIAGARERADIAEELMTIHVARGGRKGRHFVAYRVGPRTVPPTIEVLRLLHDAMDLPHHLDLKEDNEI